MKYFSISLKTKIFLDMIVLFCFWAIAHVFICVHRVWTFIYFNNWWKVMIFFGWTYEEIWPHQANQSLVSLQQNIISEVLGRFGGNATVKGKVGKNYVCCKESIEQRWVELSSLRWMTWVKTAKVSSWSRMRGVHTMWHVGRDWNPELPSTWKDSDNGLGKIIIVIYTHFV